MGKIRSLTFSTVNEKRCLPHQQTKDAAAIKPSATTAAPDAEP